MKIRTNELRHYGDIEANTTATGSRGQQSASWSAKHSAVPMKIKSLTGREAEIARQLVATATNEIVIRHKESITTEDRITWGSRTFNIGFVDRVDNRGLWLRLICTEEAQ